MDDCCHHAHAPDPHRGNPAYRRVLWAVLAINLSMFLFEIGAGVVAGSASLQADALDFMGDAAEFKTALAYAERLAAVAPNDASVTDLVNNLRRRAGSPVQ